MRNELLNHAQKQTRPSRSVCIYQSPVPLRSSIYRSLPKS